MSSSVWNRLKHIDNLTKYTINGWIRNIATIYNFNIPNIISVLCILYYYCDEIWEFCQSYIRDLLFITNILTHTDNCQYYKISKNKKYAQMLQCSEHHLYGINQVFAHDITKWKYNWDIKVCKMSQFKAKYITYAHSICIGLKSERHYFLYSSYGTKIYTDNLDLYLDANSSVEKTYGAKFYANDIISINLNLQTRQLSFALNKIDQGVAYNIHSFDIKYFQLFIKIFGCNTSLRIMNFNCYK